VWLTWRNKLLEVSSKCQQETRAELQQIESRNDSKQTEAETALATLIQKDQHAREEGASWLEGAEPELQQLMDASVPMHDRARLCSDLARSSNDPARASALERVEAAMEQAAESEAALVEASPSSPGAGKEHNTLGYHIKHLPSTRRAFLTHIDELPHLLNCSESEVAEATWDPQLKILGPAFSPEKPTRPSGKLENPFLGGTPVSAHVRVALEEFLVLLRDYRDRDGDYPPSCDFRTDYEEPDESFEGYYHEEDQYDY